MSKKIFTILLLAVFMLAQFSFVAAAPAGVLVTGVTLNTTSNQATVYGPAVTVNWSYNQAALTPITTVNYSVLIWSRTRNTVTPNAWGLATCKVAAKTAYVTGQPVPTGVISGSMPFTFPTYVTPALVAGGVVEFLMTVDDGNTASANATCAGGTVAIPANVVTTVPTSFVTIATFPVVVTSKTLSAPVFSSPVTTKLTYEVKGLPADEPHQILAWARLKSATATPTPWIATGCRVMADLPAGVTDISDVYTFVYANPGPANTPVTTGLTEVEFKITVENSAVISVPTNCTNALVPVAATDLPDTQTANDNKVPELVSMTPPTKTNVNAGTLTNTLPLACNKFEFWGLAVDRAGTPATSNISGVVGPIVMLSNGAFAAPAPTGTSPVVNSWMGTFPASATGAWTFGINPKDAAGNAVAVGGNSQTAFRNVATVAAAEKAACKSFTDTVGNANEAYVNYLASLGLISGTTTTTYDPSANLTRAQAATLFVRAGGQPALAAAPSVACTFSDILDTANAAYKGFIWQACANGWIKGYVAGTATTPGTFGPSDTFLRRDIAQIFNNIATTTVVPTPALTGSFLAPNSATYRTVLNTGNALLVAPNNFWVSATPFRTLAWSDVAIGDYYVAGANSAYQTGVMEATGATTFGPLLPVTRGDFAKMLYRALSRLN